MRKTSPLAAAYPVEPDAAASLAQLDHDIRRSGGQAWVAVQHGTSRQAVHQHRARLLKAAGVEG